MERAFITDLMTELNFPAEAKTFLTGCLERISQRCEAEFDGVTEFYYENGFDLKLTEPLLDEVSILGDVHRYTVDMLFLLSCAKRLRGAYAQKGIPDRIFLDTMCDLRFKLYECYETYGIWGTFVTFWYGIFFSCDLFRLSRLEYENTTYAHDIPFEKYGVTVRKGTPVKSIHIPSHCGPLTKELRMQSYKLAYDFFQEELAGKPLICICHSWLLHSSTKEILPAQSNTVSFVNDFEILSEEDFNEFHDLWRVFGDQKGRPFSELPENTSMQRAYKQWLMDGKKLGAGLGILVFDGEKLLGKDM